MLAILETPEMRRHAVPVSVAGYEKMGELGLVEEKTELIRGVIFEKMSKSPLHSALIWKCVRALAQALGSIDCIRTEQPLRLKDSCPEPDVAVVEPSPDDYMSRHPSTALLVIEISISSEALDREKISLYAEAGIAEYWLILPERRTTERFSRPSDGRYTGHMITAAGEICASALFPEFQVRLADWLV